MVTNLRTLYQALILMVCLFSLSTAVKGQDNPFVNVLRGDSGKIVKDAVLTTADLTYYIDPENPRYDTTNAKYGNIISLVLNQESTFFIPGNFTVSVPLHITMVSATEKDGDGNFRSIELDTSLSLNFRKDSGTYVSRSFLVDSGYRYVTVKIRNDINSNVSWDVTQVLTLENEMRISRNYFFELPGSAPASSSRTASTNATSAPPISCSVAVQSLSNGYNATTGELQVSWIEPRANETGYDLEWAWIDQNALADYMAGGTYASDLIFTNNASRVTIGAGTPNYSIPLFYDDAGKLFYRVRPVQDRVDGRHIEGAWTTAQEGSTVNAFDFTGHQNNLNWQVTTSYAEEGKRKTVIQYFDGTLRSRQTVTKDNTLGTTVVAETMYDYQGRPAIQVLPAPTLSTMIGFTKNFNQGINGEYTKGLYDGLNAGDIICLKPAQSMEPTSGASLYYSTANPERNNGVNRFIPDAQKYPFTETRYTPDATGRIAAQSGVGLTHILNSGHETRYYYGQADQEDLDPLFGTDVGYASHYFKNMVRDANGQYSVSYVDMHGRTVATALAGTNPANLQPLASLIPRSSVTKKLLDKETNIVKGRSIESQKELLVPVRGTYVFDYKLDPQALSLLDKSNNQICYSCMYDLEIEISNDCGNCYLPNNQPIYIRRNNLSLTKLDTSSCDLVLDTIGLRQSVVLEEGSYTIRKTLTLSQQAQDTYREGLYTRRNMVRSFESVYQNTLLVMQQAGTNCANDSCDVCNERIGTTVAIFRDRYLTEAQISIPTPQQEQEIVVAYAAAKAQCDANCNKGTTPLDGIRGAMLQDMMPDSGQYANISVRNGRYNIFNTASNKWKTPYSEVTDMPGCYQDNFGNCVVVNTTNVDTFISVFQGGWARNLLYYHPEYYRLRLAEDPAYLKPSYDFDQQIQEITTWGSAVRFITGRDNTHFSLAYVDPFFTISPPDFTTMDGYIDRVFRNGSVAQPPQTYSASMWQLAIAAVTCKDNSSAICLNSRPKIFGAFPTGTCTADQDMIWNVFRQMYLFEKQKLVYSWTTNKIRVLYPQAPNPTTADLALLGYTPRFVNPATLSVYPGGLVGITSVSQNDINPAIYTVPGQRELDKLYADNCTALATNWRNRLEVLKNCNSALTDGDIDNLVLTLVEICKKGSNLNHPLGSTSVAPGSSFRPKSFEEAISLFLKDKGIPYSGSCNPYMLSDIDPGPYANSQPYYNTTIVTQPDTCVCNRLSSLFSEYKAARYPGTQSEYLKQIYGTVISQGALDTLNNLCTGNGNCQTLTTPIVLPPLLQCGGPTQVCIDCKTFQTYKNIFQDTFHTVWPQANHPVDTIQPLDSAFASFMNYKTGFHYTAVEYLQFQGSCKYTVELNNTSCDTLRNLISNFKNDLPTTNCASAIWRINPDYYTTDPVTPLCNAVSDGTLHVPAALQSQFLRFDMIDTSFCWPDEFAVETRIQTPGVYAAYNISMGLIYQDAYGQDLAGPRRYLSVDLPGSQYPGLGKYFVDGLATAEPNTAVDLNTWRTLRIEKDATNYRCYIDGVLKLITPVPAAHTGQKHIRFSMAMFERALQVDWVKVYTRQGSAPYGQLIYDEEFNSSSTFTLPSRQFKCSYDCEQAFVQYYNTTNGTNYTFNQLDNISIQTCGKRLDVCTPYPAQSLDSIVKAFVKRRDYRLNRHIEPLNGCDTTHWASNQGQGLAQQYPIGRAIQGGVFRGSLLDPVNPLGFDYFDDICFDSMTVEARIMVPGNNPNMHTWYYQFAAENADRAAFFFDVYADHTAVHYFERQPYHLQLYAATLPYTFDQYRTLKVVVGQKQYHLYIDGQHIGDFDHTTYYRFTDMYFDTFGGCQDLVVDYMKILGSQGQVMLDEQFTQGCGLLDYIKNESCEPADCTVAFAQFYNSINKTNLTYSQLDTLYNKLYGRQMDVCGATSIYNEPRLCGNSVPKFPTISIVQDTCGSELPDLAFNKATEYYRFYKDSLQNVFDTAYYNKCLRGAPPETLSVTYDAYEYHYTLYYYDQAGNLVQTVPPEGVHPVYDLAWLADIANRRVTNGDTLRPAHTLKTQYRYNTLNQVVEQLTPDAGKSNFWYDRLGRLVVSQNAKQKTTNRYSYTLYDGIGRITEVGQKPKLVADILNQDITRDTTALKGWLTAGNNKEEITRTVYDVSSDGMTGIQTALVQRNLRNRVSYTMLFDKEADQYDVNIKHQAATYYSYDIHGNVDTLVQDINQSVMHTLRSNGNRFKKIDYNYDLISGKVNYVAYQRGQEDQFFHRYSYDPENRITDVQTSPDEIYWERDAKYEYYKHGPLARTILGQLKVQGIDYAYTLQGWMKGVNSTSLQTADDMGSDGTSSTAPAKDVLGFSLNYYTYGAINDYQPIGVTGNRPFAPRPGLEKPDDRPTSATGGSLFNGNISMMMVNLPRVGEPILYNYTYDQLNRIVAQDAYTGLDPATNQWTGGAVSNGAKYTTSYKERVSYDANGNIISYLRNGYSSNNRQPDMDKLYYQYERNSITGMLSSNRLRFVRDAVDADSYATDIDDQSGGATLLAVQNNHQASQPTDNYQYDAIGNLIKDKSGKLESVKWTVYGKISEITKTDSTKIRYTYDAAGNRLTKTVTIGTKTKVTVYVRDAQGNVLSVYTRQNNNNLKQAEVDLYGSSRLGIWKPERDVQTLDKANIILSSFVQGQKEYELSNHLGNVMATLSDTRTAMPTADGSTVDHYEAMVLSAHDYYPFGMQLPGRNRTDGTAGSIENPTGRIRREAEDFNSSNNVTIDRYYEQSGGAALYPLPQGAWAAYTINTPSSGNYTIKIRLSNYYQWGAQLQIRNEQGTVLSTINVDNTGWVSNYYTYSGTITLPAGQQTLTFYCSQPSFGMDWWEIAPPGTLSGASTIANTQHIEAENYTAQENMPQSPSNDIGGTDQLSVQYGGAYADYRISAPIAGTYNVRLRVSSGNNNTVLQIKNAGGAVLASVNVPYTGGNYTTLTTTMTIGSGEQTLRVYAAAPYYSINWWEIELPADADNQALLLNNSESNGGGLIYEAPNNFTTEFWVKPTTTHEIDDQSNSGVGGLSGQKFIIFPSSGGNSYWCGSGISVGTNGVSVYEHGDNYMPATLVWQSDTLITSWMHVAVVYTNGRPSLYINGQWKKTGEQSGKNIVYPGTQFPGSGVGSAGGAQLDEVRIWKVSRTAAEIQASMNGEIAGNTPGLLGYWPMNEGSGNLLHDVSGNGRDVSLNSSYGSGNWIAGRYSVELSSSYRYAFNGKELDGDLGSDDYDYGLRIYDARLGKFLSVDPYTKKYPYFSSYQYAGNGPISNNDKDGGEPQSYTWNWKPKSLFDLNSKQKLSDNGGMNKTVYDAKLGNVDVAIIYDAWSNQNWFVHQDNQGQWYYLKNDNGKHDVLSMKGGTIDVVGGHLEPFKTYNEIAYEQTVALTDAIATGTAGAVILPFAMASLPSLWAAWANPWVQAMIGGDIAGAYMYESEYAATAEMETATISSPSTSPVNTETNTYQKAEFLNEELRMSEQPLSGSDARVILGKALDKQGIVMEAPNNFKQTWSEGGYDYEVRIHQAQSNAPVGSNSAEGTTFRVARRLQGSDKNGQGQGWEQADDANHWYPTKELKAGNNPAANNDTHIPLRKNK